MISYNIDFNQVTWMNLKTTPNTSFSWMYEATLRNVTLFAKDIISFKHLETTLHTYSFYVYTTTHFY